MINKTGKFWLVLSVIAAGVVIAASGAMTGCSNQSDRTFTSAPQTPNTPEEVTAAWYFLLNGGDYAGAMKLFFGSDETYSPAVAGGPGQEQTLEIDRRISAWMNQMPAGGSAELKDKKLKQITIKNVEKASHRAEVNSMLYFTDGTAYDAAGTTLLIYDNTWHVR